MYLSLPAIEDGCQHLRHRDQSTKFGD